jgi:hypothetical protein
VGLVEIFIPEAYETPVEDVSVRILPDHVMKLDKKYDSLKQLMDAMRTSLPAERQTEYIVEISKANEFMNSTPPMTMTVGNTTIIAGDDKLVNEEEKIANKAEEERRMRKVAAEAGVCEEERKAMFNYSKRQFENNLRRYHRNTLTSSKDESNVSHSGTLFVYTDLIKRQYIGDKLARCIRVINTGSGRHQIFQNPYYLPIERKEFDSIEIFLANKMGKPFPFVDGLDPAAVMLHFKM